MLWLLLAVWILQLRHPCVHADKHFALLQGTLKTFQKAVCDDQQVSLRCPPGTCISVLIAQYGSSNQALQELCPDLRAAAHPRANLTCVWPTSLQYSLLQTVMEACHKKRQCKFHVTSNTFSGDPCPGFRKYIEVAYKCRPYEFRSKMACQDDTLQLTCNPHSRVAVYSASFGRTEYESVRCPQPQGVREETCLANYATETVMEICHGKRQCSVTADANTFSNPCSRHSRTYLKVVYTCVPKTVLRQQPDDQVNDDERTEPDYDVDYEDALDNSLQENHVYSESPKMAVAGGRHNSSGLVVSSLPAITEGTPPPHPSIGSNDDFTETRSRLIVGLVFAITCGLVLLAALVTTRYCFARQRCRAPKGAPDSGLTKGYLEDVSEDVEIDLTTPAAITVLPTSHHASPQEVIRYKGEAPLSMGLTSSADYCYG